jgi:hypothetical protein
MLRMCVRSPLVPASPVFLRNALFRATSSDKQAAVLTGRSSLWAADKILGLAMGADVRVEFSTKYRRSRRGRKSGYKVRVTSGCVERSAAVALRVMSLSADPPVMISCSRTRPARRWRRTMTSNDSSKHINLTGIDIQEHTFNEVRLLSTM